MEASVGMSRQEVGTAEWKVWVGYSAGEVQT